MAGTQRARALELLKSRHMLRLKDVAPAHGIGSETLARLVRDEAVVRPARGPLPASRCCDGRKSCPGRASALVPKGIVCLTSALQFHELTLANAVGGLDGHRSHGLAALRSTIHPSGSYASPGPLSPRASNGIASRALRCRHKSGALDRRLLPLSDESRPRLCNGGSARGAPTTQNHKR